jgi:hypothetical protein
MHKENTMITIRNFTLGILLPLLIFSTALAQTRQTTQSSDGQGATMIVTVTASTARMRCATLGEVKQTRLQVFSADGTQIFDSDFKLGNLIDWPLIDQQGVHLTDGTYLFLITVKDFSDHLTQKYGSAFLEDGQVFLEQTGKDGLPTAQATALNANQLAAVLTSIDRIGVAAGLNRTTTTTTDGGTTIDAAPSGKKNTATSKPTTGGENIAGTGAQNKIAKWIDNAATLGDSNIFDNGNIGIGTSSPATKLDLVGTLTLRNTLSSPGFKVGDRASAPGTQMVYGAAPGSPFSVLNTFVQGSTLAAPTISQFSAWTSDIDTDPNNATQFTFVHFPTQGGVISTVAYGTATANKISIQPNWNGSAAPTALVVNTNGNVGIGTSNPQVKLDVAGDISVLGNAMITGNIAAKYQDVAEWVPARQKITAGTVVILDATRANAVAPSYRAYDTRIAGVVSAKPGLILGEGGIDKVMVATTGRVKVQVDASRHPIKIGDLLVTSGKSGAAMKSLPIRMGRTFIHRPGTIIGKALEPLARGKGEILVLLSLQ